MAIEKYKTKFLGVRYREHSTRKHGIKADRCYFIRYQLNGKDKEESVGWSSEGISAEKAFKLLSMVRDNIRLGKQGQTIAEIRKLKIQEIQDTQDEDVTNQRATITFSQFWESKYLPISSVSKKASTMVSESFLYKKWISPAIGDIEMCNITPEMLENITVSMQKCQKSAASIRYMLAVVSQVWTLANTHEVVQKESPTKKIKKPHLDNQRMRFLTREEAKLLLEALNMRSFDMHDAALLSLFSGLRAGELWSLTWADVNFEQGTLYVRDPKNRSSRHAYLTEETTIMLRQRYHGQSKAELVFPARSGGKRTSVSDTFERTVRDLGFNKTGEIGKDGSFLEIQDARQRVVFHTLRHTFASWLVQTGTPIYTLAQLMGHKDIKMTQRYSHLAPDQMQSAVKALQGVLD